MPQKAVIFAAGEGKRMQPLTLTKPKPLVELRGKPMIYYALCNIHQHNLNSAHKIDDVYINLRYMAGMIEGYLEEVSPQFNFNIHTIIEGHNIETGGGLKNITKHFGLDYEGKDEYILTLNADAVFRYQEPNHNPVSEALACYNNEPASTWLFMKDYKQVLCDELKAGNFDIVSDGKLKLSQNPQYVYTGVGVVSLKEVVRHTKESFSLREVFLKLEQENALYGKIMSADFLHIGTEKGLKIGEGLVYSF